MAIGDKTGRVTWFVVVAASACNDQFDFDVAPRDSGPPIIVTEASTTDDSSNFDSVVEPPSIGVRIACGTSDCLTPGCCSSSAGLACVDVPEGGTCSGVLIQCDDSDDCPDGQVCCAEGDGRNLSACSDADGCQPAPKLQRVHCEPEAHCRSDSAFVILCNPDRPSPCAQCETSSLPGLPSGYHQCAAAP